MIADITYINAMVVGEHEIYIQSSANVKYHISKNLTSYSSREQLSCTESTLLSF